MDDKHSKKTFYRFKMEGLLLLLELIDLPTKKDCCGKNVLVSLPFSKKYAPNEAQTNFAEQQEQKARIFPEKSYHCSNVFNSVTILLQLDKWKQ